MLKDHKKCILCNNKQLEIITSKLRDDKIGQIFRCSDCDINMLDDQANLKELENWYDGDYRQEHGPKLSQKNEYENIHKIAIKHLGPRINSLKPYLNNNTRLLDIGCSTGSFIGAIKDYIKEAVGTDLDIGAASFANKITGCKTFGGPLEESPFNHESFDIITMTHVLEHTFDPVEFMHTLNQYLKPGGIVYIEVPNLDDALLKLYNSKTFITIFYHIAHRWYFTSRSLKKLMKMTGFNGQIYFSQMYNVLNHIQWALVDKPMSLDIAQGTPNLPMAESVPIDIKKDFQEWIQETDLAYSEILGKHGMTDQIAFIGEKISFNK